MKRTDDRGGNTRELARGGIPERFSFAASGKNHEGRYTRFQILSERRISKGKPRVSRASWTREPANPRGYRVPIFTRRARGVKFCIEKSLTPPLPPIPFAIQETEPESHPARCKFPYRIAAARFIASRNNPRQRSLHARRTHRVVFDPLRVDRGGGGLAELIENSRGARIFSRLVFATSRRNFLF